MTRFGPECRFGSGRDWGRGGVPDDGSSGCSTWCRVGPGFGGGSGGCECWWSKGRIEDRLPGLLPWPGGWQVEGDAPCALGAILAGMPEMRRRIVVVVALV